MSIVYFIRFTFALDALYESGCLENADPENEDPENKDPENEDPENEDLKKRKHAVCELLAAGCRSHRELRVDMRAANNFAF